MSKAAIVEAVKTLDLAAARRLLEAKPALLAAADREGRSLVAQVAGRARCLTRRAGSPGRDRRREGVTKTR